MTAISIQGVYLLIFQEQLPVCDSISILNFLKMINSLQIYSNIT